MAKVAKVVELVASSDTSFDEAMKTALKRASKTLRDITGMEVTNQTVDVKDGQITNYKITVKLAFGMEDSDSV